MHGLLNVLCVEVNFAVGVAVTARLRGLANVAHRSQSAVTAENFDFTPYDVVLLCPYIPDRVRGDIVAQLLEMVPAPSIVELREEPSGEHVTTVDHCAGEPAELAAMVAVLSAATPPGWR